MAWMSSN